MAVGDDATAAGYPLVPDTGSEDARVRWGAREINRTRDLIAQVKGTVKAIWAITEGGTGANNKADARLNLGISSGTAAPNNANGADGDIYLKIV